MFSRKASFGVKSAIWMIIVVFVATFLLADFMRMQNSDAALSGLPHPMQMVSPSKDFNRPLLKGIVIDPENPLKLKFIIDAEDFSKLSKKEVKKIINYFLAGLSVPEEKLWVNLSPYETDRIIEETLGDTELGEGLLKQDYVLKQLSSSLTHPDSKLGQEYWKMLFADSGIKKETFNKIWIVPGKAEVYEKNNTVLINEASLKVMTENDYLALQKSSDSVEQAQIDTNQESSSVVRELIVPEVEKDVNNGKNFVELRQIYNSLILAMWFKGKIKDAVFASYMDSDKVQGIDFAVEDIEGKVFSLYTESFEKGVYSLIKKDTSVAGKSPSKRRYFSGGANFRGMASSVITVPKLSDLTRRSYTDSADIFMASIEAEPIDLVNIKRPEAEPINLVNRIDRNLAVQPSEIAPLNLSVPTLTNALAKMNHAYQPGKEIDVYNQYAGYLNDYLNLFDSTKATKSSILNDIEQLKNIDDIFKAISINNTVRMGLGGTDNAADVFANIAVSIAGLLEDAELTLYGINNPIPLITLAGDSLKARQDQILLKIDNLEKAIEWSEYLRTEKVFYSDNDELRSLIASADKTYNDMDTTKGMSGVLDHLNEVIARAKKEDALFGKESYDVKKKSVEVEIENLFNDEYDLGGITDEEIDAAVEAAFTMIGDQSEKREEVIEVTGDMIVSQQVVPPPLPTIELIEVTGDMIISATTLPPPLPGKSPTEQLVAIDRHSKEIRQIVDFRNDLMNIRSEAGTESDEIGSDNIDFYRQELALREVEIESFVKRLTGEAKGVLQGSLRGLESEIKITKEQLKAKTENLGGIDLANIKVLGQGSSSIELKGIKKLDIAGLSYDILSIDKVDSQVLLAWVQ